MLIVNSENVYLDMNDLCLINDTRYIMQLIPS